MLFAFTPMPKKIHCDNLALCVWLAGLLSRRKKAYNRQQKLMAKFASKQKAFMAQAQDIEHGAGESPVLCFLRTFISSFFPLTVETVQVPTTHPPPPSPSPTKTSQLWQKHSSQPKESLMWVIFLQDVAKILCVCHWLFHEHLPVAHETLTVHLL